MSTVVELTEQEIAELKAVTKAGDVSSAVRTATTEYVRYVRRRELKELSGRVEMLDNWREQEAAELRKQHGGTGPCAG